MKKSFIRFFFGLLLAEALLGLKANPFDYNRLRAQVAPVKKHFVALTFDDGPSPITTPVILKVLKHYNVKATFFMLGRQIQRYPELVKAVMDEGHEIGNHSYSHAILSNQSLSQVQNELKKTQDLLRELGVHATWFRPPYGKTNKAIEKISAALGMEEMLWTVDSEDWRNTHRMLQNIEQDLRPGAVILMHDTKRTTSEMLPLIITTLKSQGYTFVTLSTWKENLKD